MRHWSPIYRSAQVLRLTFERLVGGWVGELTRASSRVSFVALGNTHQCPTTDQSDHCSCTTLPSATKLGWCHRALTAHWRDTLRCTILDYIEEGHCIHFQEGSFARISQMQKCSGGRYRRYCSRRRRATYYCNAAVVE